MRVTAVGGRASSSCRAIRASMSMGTEEGRGWRAGGRKKDERAIGESRYKNKKWGDEGMREQAGTARDEIAHERGRRAEGTKELRIQGVRPRHKKERKRNGTERTQRKRTSSWALRGLRLHAAELGPASIFLHARVLGDRPERATPSSSSPGSCASSSAAPSCVLALRPRPRNPRKFLAIVSFLLHLVLDQATTTIT
jgi:hypothetical protein